MIYNTAGRLLKESYTFHLGNKLIKPTKSYCYLGVTFSLNGSFKQAIKNLSIKASKAYFQIRRTIDVKMLSPKSLYKLHDSLIKPIATYACQIWLPDTNLMKCLYNEANGRSNNLLEAAAKDKTELTHLKFLKWSLGLHKKKRATPIAMVTLEGSYWDYLLCP